MREGLCGVGLWGFYDKMCLREELCGLGYELFYLVFFLIHIVDIQKKLLLHIFFYESVEPLLLQILFSMSNVIKLVNKVVQFRNNLLTNCTNFIISHFLQTQTNYCVFVISDSVVLRF